MLLNDAYMFSVGFFGVNIVFFPLVICQSVPIFPRASGQVQFSSCQILVSTSILLCQDTELMYLVNRKFSGTFLRNA